MTRAEGAAGRVMASRTVLVTGATSGLGLATAQTLTAQGATTILGAHSSEQGDLARRRVAAVATDADVHVLVADLSSQAAVRAMASEILEKFDRLDVLINNAGVDVGMRQVTADGMELTFAVNYLAPFLLTNLLLGRLRASAPARVINVVSSGYKGGRIEFGDLQSERRFSGQRAYNSSKLALVVFTYELASRLAGSGVTVNAVDPGFVRGTRIGATLPAGYTVLAALMWPFMATVEKGAETAVRAASDPALANVSGRYLKRGRELATGPPTKDRDLAQRLWETTERLVAMDRPPQWH